MRKGHWVVGWIFQLMFGGLQYACIIFRWFKFEEMSSPEKSITLSILKALNWTQEETRQELELCFYSLLSKAIILQKNINASVSNRLLIINTSLKITYTSEESQILLKMSKIGQDGSAVFVSEFLIDLELLQERKVQYLPFEKNDRILEVVSGVQWRDGVKEQRSVVHSNRLDIFIQEKSEYLKNVSSQNGSSNWAGPTSCSDKNFTQKLYSLLQETRRLRSKIERQKKGPQMDTNGFSNDDLNKNSEKLSSDGEDIENGRLLVKSSSQNLLTVPKSFTKKVVNNGQKHVANKRWAVAGQYKLDLKNLAIMDPRRLAQDTIKQDEQQVLRSKQQVFSSFKGNRRQQSAYLLDNHQNS